MLPVNIPVRFSHPAFSQLKKLHHPALASAQNSHKKECPPLFLFFQSTSLFQTILPPSASALAPAKSRATSPSATAAPCHRCPRPPPFIQVTLHPAVTDNTAHPQKPRSLVACGIATTRNHLYKMHHDFFYAVPLFLFQKSLLHRLGTSLLRQPFLGFN